MIQPGLKPAGTEKIQWHCCIAHTAHPMIPIKLSGSKIRSRVPQWESEIGGRHGCSGLIGVGRDMNKYQTGREGPL